jgi:hypothetical protein
MDKVILLENSITPSGYFIQPGAIQFDNDASYPISMGIEYESVGILTDVRREGNELIGWFRMIHGDVNLEHYDVSAFCDHIELDLDPISYRAAQRGTVLSGKFRGVTLIHSLVRTVQVW